MEIYRESVQLINEEKYTRAKMNIMKVSNEYIRECFFVREIKFEYIKRDADTIEDTTSIQYLIWFNRYNKKEIYLIARSKYNNIVTDEIVPISDRDVVGILNCEYEYLYNTNNDTIYQLALQMQYNLYRAVCIKEYFQENYYNLVRRDKVTFESMEMFFINDVKDFFSDNLEPMEQINYDEIVVKYKQNIMLPSAYCLSSPRNSLVSHSIM